MRKTCEKKMFWFDMYRKTEEQVEEIDGVMDWEFKEFSWETNDLEQKENGDLSALVEFGRLERKDKKAESLVDMKFQVSDSVDGLVNKSKDFKATTSKRHNGTRKPCCLVDGCKADLSNCREYHKRHRVCERHSKTPIVTIKGEEKRFCQQCSRFHSLEEFDEGKRSCRKRLDGHNRRRRKTQPEPFYWSSKNFMSSYKGPRILQFGSPHIYAAPTVENMWPLNTKTEAGPLIGDPIQGNYTSGPLNPNNTPQERSIGSHVLPSEAITLPIDSGGCALYLLSSNQTQTSEMTFNQWVQSNMTPSIQPLDSSRRLNSGFANLVEYPFPCCAKEQANWESIANF